VDVAGVVVAIACDECGQEFTVARPDEEGDAGNGGLFT
jgi:hypothetical protein